MWHRQEAVAALAVQVEAVALQEEDNNYCQTG